MASTLKKVISRLFMDRDPAIGNDPFVEAGGELRGRLYTILKNGPGDSPGRVTLFDEQTQGLMEISPSGAFEVGELIRLIGGNFEDGALLPNIWLTNLVNGGTAVAVDAELIMSTNTAANGASFVQSANRARFVSGTFNKGLVAAKFPGFNNSNVIRRWGCYDPVAPIKSGDGLFFENDSGSISIVVRKGGVDTKTPIDNFNGNPVSNTDPTIFIEDENFHIYQIIYNGGSLLFFQDRRLVHRINVTTTIAIETLHLTVGTEIQNTNGNIVNNFILIAGLSVSRIGTLAANPDRSVVSVAETVNLKNSPGTLRRILILDTGVAGASIEIYDALDALGTPLFTIDLTESILSINFGFDFNTGLTYVSSGSQFEVMIIFD